MKLKAKISLFLFLVVFSKSYSQDYSELKRKINLIIQKPIFRLDSTGLKLLPKVNWRCDSSEFSINGDSKYYHVIDLNLDGKNDLIFSGPCNPYDETSIFINKGDKLDLIFERGGKLVSIEKSQTQTKIYTLLEPCCCMSDYTLTEITFDRKSQTSINSIHISGGIKIILGELRKIKAKGIVRHSTTLDDTPRKDNCSNRMLIGNHIEEIKSNTEVIELNKIGEWSLILLNKDFNHSIIGWIKI